RRGGHRDRHAAEDVGAVALEEAMRADRHENVEITRRRAAQTGLALAGEANTRAVLDAGRDLDLQDLLLARAAGAGAARTRLVDHAPGAVAARAGALDGEEALLGAHLAVALAGRTVDRLGARRGARALARLAGLRRRDLDLGVGALERILEADLEIEAQIGAAAGTALAPAAAHELAEHLVEDVGEAGAEIELEAGGTAARSAVLERGMAIAVVGGALLIVLQDVVGLADVLEALL